MWYAAMAQLVEHILGKDEVPGPNPGSSSRRPRSESFGALAFYRALRLVGAATRYGTGDGYGHPSEALKPEESTGLFTVRIGDCGADLRQVLCKSFIWVRAFIVEIRSLEQPPGTARLAAEWPSPTRRRQP